MLKQFALVMAFVALAVPVRAADAFTHPDTKDFKPLFADDLSNAVYDKAVWSVANGELTATKDDAIWTKEDMENFVLDLEFKTDDATNSGVVVYCTDTASWIPHSVEIQIADDFSKEWSEKPATWHCAAIFGHLAPTESVVKKPGEWNHYTITCKGKQIDVVFNGKHVTSMDMSKWTSAKSNPDGSPIPPWLSTPFAEQPTKGKIGLQGKHGKSAIWFRNIKVKALDK